MFYSGNPLEDAIDHSNWLTRQVDNTIKQRCDCCGKPFPESDMVFDKTGQCWVSVGCLDEYMIDIKRDMPAIQYLSLELDINNQRAAKRI